MRLIWDKPAFGQLVCGNGRLGTSNLDLEASLTETIDYIHTILPDMVR